MPSRVEPDPKNYRRLLDRAQREGYGDLSATTWRSAASRGSSGSGPKRGGGTAPSPRQGKGVVPVETVDNLLAGSLGHLYEAGRGRGRSWQPFAGAAKSIRRWGPKLSVAAYHRSEDLFQLPLYLHSLQSDYRFYLRKHPYIPAWGDHPLWGENHQNEENPA